MYDPMDIVVMNSSVFGGTPGALDSPRSVENQVLVETPRACHGGVTDPRSKASRYLADVAARHLS